ncbi:class I SAM-dependent methyltransferase [Subtercola boreus]|uniref:Methyltransferase type 11 domain-containing protein n=1 Tax=Subtercola boreus TaxID=120213 RepID=A0A3E0WG10_9MICO|nr:class I SAM-dependent methyltransferase [Subtercola boreus]RFA23373.1 hypothetical protein B7R24_00265 [Subtercola boreus]RFA23766.1 hypothetical protein B7R23_00265 [Subtercola boreus]RFA29467.1 hypothetical protein B7R25_00260 [Subtercola boreus]
MQRDTSNALSFGNAVAAYELGRPSYPAAAVEWMLAQLGGEPAGRTFVDVGAGTGKFTAALLHRGAEVVAVEPDATMRATLSANLPEVRALEGTGEHLPVGDGSADLVTFAQAWHWVDEHAASAEIARALKATGALALVWNIRDDRVDWVQELTGIMGSSAAEDYDSIEPPLGAHLERSAYAEFFWENPLTRDQVIAMITSRSYIIAMGSDERAALLDRVEKLLDEHPHLAHRTVYPMPYVTRMTIARPLR